MLDNRQITPFDAVERIRLSDGVQAGDEESSKAVINWLTVGTSISGRSFIPDENDSMHYQTMVTFVDGVPGCARRGG